ncbi:MAG: ATP-binding protein [Acetobacteraceae bacterium]
MTARTPSRRRTVKRLIDRLAEPGDDLQILLFEDPGAGLLVVDKTGLIVRANATLQAMVAEAAACRPGQPALDLVSVQDRRRFDDVLLAGRRGDLLGRPERIRLRGPDQTEGRRVMLSMMPLSEPDRTFSGVLLRLTDITAETHLEAELAEGRKLQAVGQMAGGIAHDFNNLLTTMLTAADSVLERPGIEPDIADDMRVMRLAAERGAALVRQLLAFSRRQPLRPRVLAVNGEIQDLSGLLLRLLGNSIRLDLVLEEPGRKVLVDPTQFDQVLINLAVNARDAMPRGGRLIVRTGHQTIYRPEPMGAEVISPGRYVTIDVEDTGTGIAPDVLPRIFEPFFTTRRHAGGTGLGLSTVIGIVRQSGGFITVHSIAGRGTTVRVALPRCDEPASEHDPEPDRPAIAAEPARCGTILLVDDEEPLRLMTERALRRGGWTVIAVSSAEEALSLVRSGQVTGIDVLVSDVVMPGLDGFGLVAGLRQMLPNLAAVLVSGYAESVLRRDAALERVAFLPKPYQMKDLTSVIGSLLEHPVLI